MKRLILLRHFKSAWHEAGTSDRDRPLTPRGRHDAGVMAKTMVADDFTPDRILCSPARRTRETLAGIESVIGAMKEITAFVDELYAGAEIDYRAIVATMGGDADRLMVIGHNPRVHATALALVGTGNKDERANLAHKYPTGALTVIEFDADTWPTAAEGGGRLVAFIRPRTVEQEA